MEQPLPYFAPQRDDNLCGMYAVNHLLQEGKCVYVKDLPAELVMARADGGWQAAPPDASAMYVDVKINMAALCARKPDYCSQPLRDFYADDLLKDALRMLGYEVKVDAAWSVAGLDFDEPEVRRGALRTALKDHGVLGVLVNVGGYHWTTYTRWAVRCGDPGEHKLAYIDSLVHRPQYRCRSVHDAYTDPALDAKTAPTYDKASSVGGRTRGYLAVSVPPPGAGVYPSVTARKLWAARRGVEVPPPLEFRSVASSAQVLRGAAAMPAAPAAAWAASSSSSSAKRARYGNAGLPAHMLDWRVAELMQENPDLSAEDASAIAEAERMAGGGAGHQRAAPATRKQKRKQKPRRRGALSRRRRQR